MPVIDTLTNLVAGPKTVAASQERAARRTYSGLEAKMRAIRDISPEAPPSATPSIASGYNSSFSSRAPSHAASRAPSRAPSLERQPRPPLLRPELQRSQSELPFQAKVLHKKPEFTPCITANELTSEQIKRNYSHDDLHKWDRTQSPLPPLNQCVGLGKYRTAIHADKRWRAEQFQKKISGLDGLESMIADLDMANINGMSHEEWKEITDRVGRRGSAISSNSTQTTSSNGVVDSAGGSDSLSGLRITRGFSPSASASTRSSFGNHSRKNSTLSVMSKAAEGESESVRKGMQRQSAVSNPERRASGHLCTIDELHVNSAPTIDAIKRIERPCHFSGEGDPDSAVASDAEDSEDGVWTDERPVAISAITQMFKGGKKPEAHPGLSRVRTTSSERKRSMTSIDRSKTIRAHAPPSRRRKSSKAQHNLSSKTKLEEKQDENFLLPSPESVDHGSETHIQLLKLTTDAPKLKNLEDKKAIVTDEGTLLAEEQLEYQPRAPRKRSTTALYCRADAGTTTSSKQ